MQPQGLAKGHLARKKQTNSKRAFNLPVVDLSRTQDVSVSGVHFDSIRKLEV